jgi:hypothetical protein
MNFEELRTFALSVAAGILLGLMVKSLLGVL